MRRSFVPWTFILLTLWASPPLRAEPSALVQVAPAQMRNMSDELTTYGTVEFSPEHGQVLDVQGEGLVTRVLVAAGQAVRKGQPLIELQNTANANLERRNAEINVRFAAKDVQRLRSLRDRQLATNAEVLVAEQNLAKAQAILGNINKRLGRGATRVLRAGMDGVVEQVAVHAGDIAAVGTPLLRLAQGDRLRVRLGVEPEDVVQVRVGQPVIVSTLFHHPSSVQGRVTQIYRQIDPRTHLTQAVVPLPAVPDLLPGAMVRGRIILRQGLVLAVPHSAVLYQHQRPYVFVDVHGRARKRWVQSGLNDGRYIEIRTGLKAGETVVTLGNYELKDGMALRVQPGARQ